MLKIVLDTNIIISSLSKNSRYHIVIESLLQGRYSVSVNNDILLEYEEKITEKYGLIYAEAFITALLQSTIAEKVIVDFNLYLIKSDPDDNKFADVAFCSNTNYIVSNDRHFNELTKYEFPIIKVINIDEFVSLLAQQ
jgi:uncharacterized protein